MNAPRCTLWTVAFIVLASGLANTSPAQQSTDWSAFRGEGARGVADGFPLRTEWNADAKAGELEGVLWDTPIPGLGHSSPVIFGDKLFLLTAISEEGEVELQVTAGGNTKAADDNAKQSWVVLCFDKNTGRELWRKTAHEGKPKATRHTKATHANTSVSVDGENVVAFFGSEGLYCYDMEGNLRWSRDLGVIDVSKYGIGWGFASSPIIHQDQIAIVCDAPKNPYAAMLRLDDGKEIWRVSRQGDCERSWGTPLILGDGDETQMVVNGWPWIVSYDFKTGDERWRMASGGDNPIPTPFEFNGLIYITNAHGGPSPIYAVRPAAKGNLSDNEQPESAESNAKESAVAWSVERGGSYMSTPVVYEEHLYLGNSNGTVRCFHASTGEKTYEKRLGRGAGVIASLVAGDGKLFCPSENGKLYVLQPGSTFKILAENSMGEACMATPAISEGVIYVRTTKRLVAIK